jgi:hypothetical protein
VFDVTDPQAARFSARYRKSDPGDVISLRPRGEAVRDMPGYNTVTLWGTPILLQVASYSSDGFIR